MRDPALSTVAEPTAGSEAGMDPAVVAQVQSELDRVTTQFGVRIPWAIESGSRAWGFPSPDSDYDCRFVYVAGLDTYLTPWPPRDVIETPLVGLLDVNGWDLAKALRLLVNGNAVIVEWLMSPIVYRGDQAFRDALRELAEEVADRSRVARHYLHLGERQWALFGTEGPVKKLFYSLRPAMALRWLREHPDAVVAPMHLPTLMAECTLPDELIATVAELTAAKSRTREMGSGSAPSAIAAFIAAEFGGAEDAFPKSGDRDLARIKALCANFFRTEALRG